MIIIKTVQFQDRFFPNTNSHFLTHITADWLLESLSPECRLEGSHLLQGCQQWAHSLWPCGTVPYPFSLPMIKTHSPHLVKELQFLSFVLHTQTSNLTLAAWTAEVWRNLNWSNFAKAVLVSCHNFAFLQSEANKIKQLIAILVSSENFCVD